MQIKTLKLKKITASDNDSIGINITTTLGSVFISDFVTTNDNNESGLIIDASSDIDLSNVSADGNGTGGVTGSGAELNSTSGAISLLGTNIFTNNLNNGIAIDANQDVDIVNITASDNGSIGVNITATLGSVFVSSSLLVNDNGESGLVVDAFSDIDLSNLSADGNGASGVIGSGAELNSSSGAVFLAGTNIFTNNLNSGLVVDAFTNIMLDNITASNNGLTGASLNSSGSLSLFGINIFSNNAETGLYAEVVGDIDAENISAENNGVISGLGGGAEFYTLANFSLSGTNFFSNNNNTGLYIEATGGEIIAENITASNNGFGSGGGNGVEAYALSNFTLSGISEFNGNYADGLFVYAGTGINIENASASSNNGNGIYVETNGNATLTCGMLSNNLGYQIEADVKRVFNVEWSKVCWRYKC